MSYEPRALRFLCAACIHFAGTEGIFSFGMSSAYDIIAHVSYLYSDISVVLTCSHLDFSGALLMDSHN